MGYAAGDSFLHRLSPISKMIVLLIMVASLFLFENWFVAVPAAVMIILLYMAGGAGLTTPVKILKHMPLFVVLIVLAHVFLVKASDSWIVNAGNGLLRSLVVVNILLAAGLFLAVTDPLDVSGSVIAMMGPFSRVGLRTGELSLILMIALSFLPAIADEAGRLKLAQGVRCGFGGRWLGAGKNTVTLITPLIVGIFRLADEMELSLAARCYNLERPRSTLGTPVMGRSDLFVCAVAVIAFIAGLYAKLQAHN